MKNAMQLKAIIKNIAKEKRISAQFVLQNYMLERFLERLSLSAYDRLTKEFYPHYQNRSKVFFAIWDCYENLRLTAQ